MRLDKHSQWIGAIHAGDKALLREMLAEDASLANSAHAAFDDPYREERYPVSTLLFAVAGPPSQQLDWRKIERRPDLELVRILLETGADPNVECGHGLPICHVRDKELAQLLIQFGADVNRWTDCGGSPLFFSVWNADSERLRMQLELGADVSMGDPRTGESALHVACLQVPESLEHEASLLEVIGLLFDAGIDPNGRTMSDAESFALKGGPPLNEDTPLHLAAGFSGESIVRELVTRGCDLRLKNGNGQTPRDVAVNRQRPVNLVRSL
ncbi:MAG: ankyrin repeat domain-containing protein [Isosphaeraceae bacterium]